jgi:hypothetical protein
MNSDAGHSQLVRSPSPGEGLIKLLDQREGRMLFGIIMWIGLKNVHSIRIYIGSLASQIDLTLQESQDLQKLARNENSIF